jgi:hypothetical protein
VELEKKLTRRKINHNITKIGKTPMSWSPRKLNGNKRTQEIKISKSESGVEEEYETMHIRCGHPKLIAIISCDAMVIPRKRCSFPNVMFMS